jgi:hypothetical protein
MTAILESVLCFVKVIIAWSGQEHLQNITGGSETCPTNPDSVFVKPSKFNMLCCYDRLMTILWYDGRYGSYRQ